MKRVLLVGEMPKCLSKIRVVSKQVLEKPLIEMERFCQEVDKYGNCRCIGCADNAVYVSFKDLDKFLDDLC